MNNRCFIFRSKFLSSAYCLMGEHKKLTQGTYKVTDLVAKFSKKKYSDKELRRVVADISYNYKKYGFHVDEYFGYGVGDMSRKEKAQFVTEEGREAFYDIFNKKENRHIFDNKLETYKIYEKYFKRKIRKITSINENKEFCDFPRPAILKPLEGSGGKGVTIIGKNEKLEDLIEFYKGPFLMEEIVYNSKELNSFHPKSLNTLRIVTLRMNDRVEFPFGFLRLGKGESFIDNAHAGGLICAIDTKTGCVTHCADQFGNSYLEHPDSHKKIIGYKLPDYDKLLKILIEIVNVVPSNRYTGWDFAHTDNGWVLIEGNARGQFVVQYATKKGLKKQFDSYVEELQHESN